MSKNLQSSLSLCLFSLFLDHSLSLSLSLSLILLCLPVSPSHTHTLSFLFIIFSVYLSSYSFIISFYLSFQQSNLSLYQIRLIYDGHWTLKYIQQHRKKAVGNTAVTLRIKRTEMREVVQLQEQNLWRNKSSRINFTTGCCLENNTRLLFFQCTYN